jgi:hypothetical protein
MFAIAAVLRSSFGNITTLIHDWCNASQYEVFYQGSIEWQSGFERIGERDNKLRWGCPN